MQICLTKSKIWNNSRTYRKYRNKPCRFHYGHFLLIARPIKARTEFEKYQILKRSEDFSNESYTKESLKLH